MGGGSVCGAAPVSELARGVGTVKAGRGGTPSKFSLKGGTGRDDAREVAASPFGKCAL